MFHAHHLPLLLLAGLFLPAAPQPGGGTPPLTITCPDGYKIFCGQPFDPSVAGMATATGGCDPTPTITFVDIVGPPICPADRFQYDIQRVWTATDSCGNSVSCNQKIHVLRQVWSLDIKPTSCPNPVNTGSNGVVPMALLGGPGQDVTQIDPSSVQVWREFCADGPVAPRQTNFEDAGTPYSSSARCGCHTLGGDGFLDMTLKFRTGDLVQGLGLANAPNFSYVRLVVTARLFDGCEILATDCIRVQ